ncbi:MAG: Druantia anti-phage system protein DruA [Candidatus Sedimenticola endophacoides]
MNASLLHVRPACATEEQRFQDLMQAHHYLGALVKIGNTIRYVAEREGRRVGLLSISASALKCAARDQWICSAATTQRAPIAGQSPTR